VREQAQAAITSTQGHPRLIWPVRPKFNSILLEVESDTPDLNIRVSLEHLSYSNGFIVQKLLLDSLHASASACRLGLNAELVQMLVVLGVKNSSNFDKLLKFSKLHNLLFNANTGVVTLRGVDECAEALNSMMDSIGDMYRCLLLSGIDENILEYRTREIVNKPTDLLIEFIISFATYSSQPGGSSKLIRHILNDLKASQIIEIKKTLLERQHAETKNTFDEDRIATQNALEWVSELQTPLTMKHLARSTINHALSYRAMKSVPSLNIPKHLKEYLLLKSD